MEKSAGVICDERASVRVKGMVYKMAVTPDLVYGLKTVTLEKRQEADKAREARLTWLGHIQRRDREYMSRRMLSMELTGKRKRRFLDVVKKAMLLVDITEEDAEER